jgi:cytochrome c peroxidase
MYPFTRKTSFFFSASVLALLYALFSFNTREQQLQLSVSRYYTVQLDSIKAAMLLLDGQAETADEKTLRSLFEQSRRYFKRAEAIIEYHFPASAQRLNGAALPESEASEPNEPQHPRGFQVLEEILYDPLTEASRKAVRFEVSNIINTTDRLRSMAADLELSEGNILDALRLNVYRMMIKGITGFDNPVALKGLPEAAETLISTRHILSFFPRSAKVAASCDSALYYLQEHQHDFDGFNRAVFIRQYITPLCIVLYDYQQEQHIPFVSQSQAISAKAKHLFEEHAIDPMYFAPEGSLDPEPALVALGQKLFRETALSANGIRSCASCHRPDKAFTDGLKVNESLVAGQTLMRNTPTLLNASLQPVQFYDSRIAFLEDQAHEVITNRAEMGGSVNSMAALLSKDPQYRKLFRNAFKGQAVNGEHIKKAIAAYIRSLNRLNSPFDRYMRGEATAMSHRQIQGFNLFTGKAKCATCHFIPLFSGAVPPLYNKMESEVLGIPANTDTLHPVMDTDSGKYLLYGIPHQLYSFKTVSLRNVALTAPYMHNGVYNTLEEVIDFYDKGGGAGLGFELAHQTLPTDRLRLTPAEKKALIAFLEALSDANN